MASDSSWRAPAPVQLSSHSTPDLASEVTPFFTAPAVVLTFHAEYVRDIVLDRDAIRRWFGFTPAPHRAEAVGGSAP
jgi:hypothetical protein